MPGRAIVRPVEREEEAQMSIRSRWWIPALVVFVLGLQPSISEAKGFGRGGKSGGSSGSSGRGGSSGSSGSSGGFGRSGSRGSSGSSNSSGGRTTYSFQGNAPRNSGGYYAPRSSYGAGTAVIIGAPAYYGYYNGWGVYPWGYYSYGYYPIWGAPSAPPPPDENNPEPQQTQKPRTKAFSLYLGGAAQRQGFAPSGSLHFEGRRWGFNVQGIGVVSEPLGDGDRAAFMPLFTTHLTYSVLSSPHFRLRAEAGISSVFAPAVVYTGPDLGTSAQLALVGPLALQAAVHYTPIPARILDVEAGLGLNFGGLGIKAGWRTLRLDDTRLNENGGVDFFNGPTVAIGAIY
jgi:hypothetical protein